MRLIHQFHSQGNYHDNGQVMCTHPHIDGKLEGLQQSYFQVKDDSPEGSIDRGPLQSQVNFVDGKQDEFAQFYLRNGQLESKKHFRDGTQDGLQETYHQNGQIKVSWNIKDEVKHRPYEDYYKNGQLKSKRQFIDGKKVSVKHYSKNGELEKGWL